MQKMQKSVRKATRGMLGLFLLALVLVLVVGLLTKWSLMHDTQSHVEIIMIVAFFILIVAFVVLREIVAEAVEVLIHEKVMEVERKRYTDLAGASHEAAERYGDLCWTITELAERRREGASLLPADVVREGLLYAASLQRLTYAVSPVEAETMAARVLEVRDHYLAVQNQGASIDLLLAN